MNRLDHNLISDMLKKDPRLSQAKKILYEMILEHQSLITGIRSADPLLKESYQNILKSYSEIRGSKLYYPYLGSGIGRGSLVELLDGSIKYDFISGIGVHYFGHSNLDLVMASIDASLSDTVMEGNLQQNHDAVELTNLLCRSSGLDHCFLTSSGAMANENALKLAFQKKTPASRILAFDRSFTGRSLILSQVTDKPQFRQGLPSNVFVDYVPFYDPKYPEESISQAVSVVKKHLLRYPKQHAAMCIELIQGEAGFYSGTNEFFTSLFTILKDNGITIFIDEVQTFGRTSSLFAYQYFGLEKFVDIVTVGKLSQVCATLFTKEFEYQGNLLSQTFISSSAAIQVGKLIISKLLNENFFGEDGKNIQIQKHFHQRLSNLSKRYPELIEGPFGVGTMVAFTPFSGLEQKVAIFAQNLFEAGVIGFVAGANPTRFRFLVPAGAISFEDIDSVVEIIEKIVQ